MEENQEKKLRGQLPNKDNKCYCQRCQKWLNATTMFYTYKDKSKPQVCKKCLTAYIDNFDPSTFVWVLQKMDVPYIPSEWNIIRDKAFADDPYKMTGLSVLGKYLSRMRLLRFKDKTFADSEAMVAELEGKAAEKTKQQLEEQKRFEESLKKDLDAGIITQAQYKTYMSTETLKEQLPPLNADAVVGFIEPPPAAKGKKNAAAGGTTSAPAPTSYQQALKGVMNPFQQKNFIPQDELPDPGEDLTKEDRIYLAMKWGRLYSPAQWVSLQKLYKQFIQSFDIQGAARIDTLKLICKTSLKLNEAADVGDIDSFQKLTRVYDTLMKSAKFTQAQNKNSDSDNFNSVGAIVDFIEAKKGSIPRYSIDEPRDTVDTVLEDLKRYTRNLIYEDKALAREIEKYLQQKKISEQMEKEAALEEKDKAFQLSQEQYLQYKDSIQQMKKYDDYVTEEQLEKDYEMRRIRRKDE